MPTELIIGDHNADQHQTSSQGHGKGLVPRNYETHPVGCYPGALQFHAVPDLTLISPSDYASRLADQVAAKALLSDVRNRGNFGKPMPSCDQGQKGYCWAHSSTAAVKYLRAQMGLPYVALNAYMVACIIKNFVDEGGWGAQSADWIMDKGVCSEEFWPFQSMSRSNVNDAMYANAAKHKITEGWIDLAAAQYDRNLSDQQVCTLLLSGTPVVTDFNWWGHSVLTIDLVNGATQFGITRGDTGKLLNLQQHDLVWGMNNPVTGGFGKRIQNSWSDSWSDNGTGILTGSKCIADGSVAPRAVMASQD